MTVCPSSKELKDVGLDEFFANPNEFEFVTSEPVLQKLLKVAAACGSCAVRGGPECSNAEEILFASMSREDITQGEDYKRFDEAYMDGKFTYIISEF